MKQEMMGGSGIRWSICKSFALCSRKIIMPAPITEFYGPDALPAAKSTVSEY